ncbi:MAG: DUF2442 domain-containing protein [Cyanobacteria bacterium J06581_3]
MNRPMSILIQTLHIDDETLSVDLSDGRTIAVPLSWYPRLTHGSDEERQNYRLIGKGNGIHWQDLDEDISIQNLIVGQPSGESQKSLQRWLSFRDRRLRDVEQCF